MTKMDDESHPECDLFVEDHAAEIMLAELLALHAKETSFAARSFRTVRSTSAIRSVRWRKTSAFPGRHVYSSMAIAPKPKVASFCRAATPPEQVVFKALRQANWGNLWSRIARDVSTVIDACTSAMTLQDHHEWVRFASSRLMCGGDVLWQAMCAEWAKGLDGDVIRKEIVQPIEDALIASARNPARRVTFRRRSPVPPTTACFRCR